MSMPNVVPPVMTSAPNVGLNNVSAANLLHNNGANIVIQKTSNPNRAGRSRGKRGTALNHGAAAFEPQSTNSPTQYQFPTAPPMGSLPMSGGPLFGNATGSTLTNPLMMAPPNGTNMSFGSPPPMQFRH